MKMKNDVNNTTEKLGVSKDEASSSDNKENRNTEIVNISMLCSFSQTACPRATRMQ